LNRLDQPHFAAAHRYAIHDIHDCIDNPPGEIAADGGEQKLTNSGSPFSHRQPGSQGDGQHHDQTKQNFAQPARRIEVSGYKTLHFFLRLAIFRSAHLR
jgi:hypothetical protein